MWGTGRHSGERHSGWEYVGACMGKTEAYLWLDCGVYEGKSGKNLERCAVARLVGSGESDLGGAVWTLSLGQLCS